MKVRVDICNPEKISGWAIDENDPSETVSLDLIVNERYQGTIFAQNKRPDLSLAVAKDGKCGFMYKFSRLIRSKPEAVITLLSSKTGAEVYTNKIVFD